MTGNKHQKSLFQEGLPSKETFDIGRLEKK
jgi:hypothetical protein